METESHGLSLPPRSYGWVLCEGGNLTNKEYFDEMMSYATAVRAVVDAARIYGIDFSGYF